MISRRAFLAGAAEWARARQASFSTDVKVVSLLATVHDRDGRVVKNLGKQDFVLLEDGQPQTIRYFERESDLPLTLGLLVDTSRSQIEALERERSASYAFLSQVLREKMDRAFIVSFDERVQMLQTLTSSRAELEAALAKLRIPGRAATLLYEAVRESSADPMKKLQGRKAFILLTDGVSFRDQTPIGTAIEFAQMADTILFSIRFSGGGARHRVRTRQASARTHGGGNRWRGARRVQGQAHRGAICRDRRGSAQPIQHRLYARPAKPERQVS